MRYLIDTDWLIDVLRDVAASIRVLDRLREHGLAVSIISAGEVYEGAILASNPSARLSDYRQFLAAFVTVPLTHSTMERFAELRAQLRRKGNLIPDFDLLIAATALEHDIILVTRNVRHFERIPEL
ncbi:MAG TPA: type II toxin-antitoxin system VapC family toxin [Chloroflexota bacterium]|jgi:predicted nucleic acid-binding protein